MKPISNLRTLIIVVVALVAIWTTIPTFRYYLHLTERPAVSTPPPITEGAEPDPSNVEAHKVWEQNNPAYISWAREHPAFVAWDRKREQLRQKAIPLGLDLIGGVDVTLRMDKEKALKNKMGGLVERITEDLKEKKIAPVTNIAEDGRSFTLRISDPSNARTAANLINQYEGELSRTVSAGEVSSEQPVRLGVNEDWLEGTLVSDIEGAKKSIQERVDRLGVTQPRISLQSGPTGVKDRIRVQVPGEKNPDRLIRTVIQPAFLEFRLVHENQQQFLDPEGAVRPEAQIPLGYEVVPAQLSRYNEETQELETIEQDFVVVERAPLTGKDLRSANVQYNPMDPGNPIIVGLEFNPEAAETFARLTTANQGRRLAILLDGVVRSAPVLDEPILNGRAVIRGGFSEDEANSLSQILKAGSLKAPLVIESRRTVGATLGAESILSGVRALGVGAILVTVFMIAYYGMAGVISVVALTLNVLIILAIMALSRATLTLSGIGGILLTIGMAVDANVLIYERIREELRSGRQPKQAIGMGFNRAFTVILDSNLTTLLTAIVLLHFTAGSVFGFALTMTFGLLANLFTGLTVTYTLCVLWFSWRGHLSLGWFAFFKNTHWDFIKTRYMSWGLSGVLLVLCLAGVFVRGGLQFGVDFKGGFRAEASFAEGIGEQEILAALTARQLRDPNVQPVIDRENYYIVDVMLAERDPEAAEAGMSDLAYTGDLVERAFNEAFGPDQYEVEMTAGFGAQTSSQFSALARLVVILASLAILAYLWARFELAFGVAAVVALLHDLLLVVMLATLWDVQITLEVVAALLVLLGFSVNDTIVIFDRIRENTRTLVGKEFRYLCNLSINQSLARTIMTSGTTFLAVLAIYFIGGEGLRDFAKVYMLGAIIGTYSSGFIATPLVYQWNEYKGNRLQQVLAAARQKKKERAKPVRSAGAATRPQAR